ncbi:hypothetical protein ABIC46_006451 [Variovorax paradoxus]
MLNQRWSSDAALMVVPTVLRAAPPRRGWSTR